MTLATIIVSDPANPVEVQEWLDQHQDATIKSMWSGNNLFYIRYE